jgi:hypothetical protein
MPPDCPEGSFPLGIGADGYHTGCAYPAESVVKFHEHKYPIDFSLLLLVFFLGYFLRGVLRSES